jgi:uncharacterized protein YcfJ
MRKTLSLLAAAATVAGPALVTTALPTDASAQSARYLSNPCGPTQRNHRVVGGGIGAVAGYYLGGKVAADNARDEGRILGALAGAAAGQEVGRRTGCQAAYRQAQHQQYAYQPGYARPSCKAIAGGRTVCLQPDGRWR